MRKIRISRTGTITKKISFAIYEGDFRLRKTAFTTLVVNYTTFMNYNLSILKNINKTNIFLNNHEEYVNLKGVTSDHFEILFDVGYNLLNDLI